MPQTTPAASKNAVTSIGTIYLDINCIDFPFDDGLFAHRETTGSQYQLEPGGSAFNFARICAQLGVGSTFIGKIGADDSGTILKKSVSKSGVTPYLTISETEQTNLAVHYVRSDGTSIMTSVGTANQSLSPEAVLEHLPQVLPQTQFLYFGGCYKLKKLLPAYQDFARLAKEAKTQVVLDHGRVSNAVTEHDIQTVRNLLPFVEYYLPSKDEFLATWDVDTIEAGCAAVSQVSLAVCIIKDSDNGVFLYQNKELSHIPAQKVKVLNTVGAGDSFNAGFLSHLLRGHDVLESAKFANAVAARKISTLGALSVSDIYAK